MTNIAQDTLQMTTKIGLFYGSTTCYTEMAGEKIRDTINLSLGFSAVTLHDIALDPITRMAEYQYLILGIPTWDFGELQEDWESHWDAMDNLDLTGKQVALYGLGDQVGYPKWFQDALGYLWAKVRTQGASTVGAWPNEGFEFEDSKALSSDEKMFVGLPLDDENQLEVADDHIDQWCDQIICEFGLV